jgi:hypothetical protein
MDADIIIMILKLKRHWYKEIVNDVRLCFPWSWQFWSEAMQCDAIGVIVLIVDVSVSIQMICIVRQDLFSLFECVTENLRQFWSSWSTCAFVNLWICEFVHRHSVQMIDSQCLSISLNLFRFLSISLNVWSMHIWNCSFDPHMNNRYRS